MVFQHIELSKQRLIENTASDCGTIQANCGYLLAELSKFFAFEHTRLNLDVVFKANDDLTSTITTPYGEARGRLSIQLVDEVVAGRYVIEKSVVSEEGKDIWVPIWSFRISRDGDVLLGDEGDISIEVANPRPHNNAISAAAKSLLYCIASTPTFKQ
ncbi:hypothetical protein ACW9HW_01780 [Pseudomonas sp. SDO5532_S415]